MYRNLRRLYRHYPNLQNPFRSSLYPTFAINCGPCTIAKRHRDFCNCPGIPCAITALGDFNDELGGHLIIYPLKLIIQFPPGSTILLLSASMDHGNVRLSHKDETRTSFTQYCPGGLMRHVEWGFRTWKELPASRKARIRAGDEARLNRLLARFSNLAGLDTPTVHN
jgi:hypothetical protein